MSEETQRAEDRFAALDEALGATRWVRSYALAKTLRAELMDRIMPLVQGDADKERILLSGFQTSGRIPAEDVAAESEEFLKYTDSIEARAASAEVKATCTWKRVNYMMDRHDCGAELDESETKATLEWAARLEGQVRDLPDCFQATARDRAELARAALTWNRIGQEATEIAGEDVYGMAFRLSDYRGKVVLLEFWGFW